MRTLALALALVSALALPAVAVGDEGYPGTAIVGRITPSGGATIVYDVTSEVKAIVADRVSDADATRRLESDALRALAIVGAKVPTAKTFEMRVTYYKSGDVSPQYGTATFAGVERFATLTMSRADFADDRDHWKEAAKANGAAPPSISFSVVGTLPPRS